MQYIFLADIRSQFKQYWLLGNIINLDITIRPICLNCTYHVVFAPKSLGRISDKMFGNKVYILVLNYNNANDTIECLKSLFNLNYANYEIVVIDNGSTNDSVIVLSNFIKESIMHIHFLKLKFNLGYAGGNNRGIEFVRRRNDVDFIWILNNDTIVDENSLSNAVKHMLSCKNMGLCGSKLIYDWDRSLLQGIGGVYNKWFSCVSHCTDMKNIDNLDYVIGAAVLVRNEFINNIGLMSEDYFLYYRS